MHKLLGAGLDHTAGMWPSISQAYEWVHRAANILNNSEGRDVFELRREYRALLAEMKHGKEDLGEIASVVACFLKVTRSYWPGLFWCYQTKGLPRTNNDLEQCFGSAQLSERRATGRKGASPTMVVRGRVRLVAAVSTRANPVSAEELRPKDPSEWQKLRGELEYRHDARREQLRFRRDPDRFLRTLEERLLKTSLPS